MRHVLVSLAAAAFLAGCVAPQTVDQRLALAVACQEYGALATAIAADIDADRLKPAQVEQVAIARGTVGPMCADQANVNTASALIAVRQAVTAITLMQIGN